LGGVFQEPEESMRWIDIILPEPGIHQELDAGLAAARDMAADILEIQERYGLDEIRVVKTMAEVGNLMFQALATWDPEAFDPVHTPTGTITPRLGQPEHDTLTGYHVRTGHQRPAMPWTWLHNGVSFVFEKHPICSSTTGSDLPPGRLDRPWMQRQVRSHYLLDETGSNSLRGTLDQLRKEDVKLPDLLFVAGHSNRQFRRMIYREAEAIQAALRTGVQGDRLARLEIPGKPVTPASLTEQGIAFQAIHFAGPTGQPARPADREGEFWMNRLIEETALPEDEAYEAAVGLEGEVLGVDPITVMLDQASENYEMNGAPDEGVADSISVGQEARAQEARARAAGGNHDSGTHGNKERTWLLDDGPVEPETLGQGTGLPPLVFSNSYMALSDLGPRFLAAGASTFIGPNLPLFSRPARIFASYAYQALGEGWCAGAAVWRAAHACRKELGKDHPAWLSYGIQGYGSLALQYL
jgi:hypothetical protein